MQLDQDVATTKFGDIMGLAAQNLNQLLLNFER